VTSFHEAHSQGLSLSSSLSWAKNLLESNLQASWRRYQYVGKTPGTSGRLGIDNWTDQRMGMMAEGNVAAEIECKLLPLFMCRLYRFAFTAKKEKILKYCQLIT